MTQLLLRFQSTNSCSLVLITSNSSEQRGAGMAVYASAREIVGPDQLLDFMLVDEKEMRLATEQEVAEIETRFEGEDETLYVKL